MGSIKIKYLFEKRKGRGTIVTGIELFLNNRIYGPEQHPYGWEKFVYDDENIHYALLQLLAERSPNFAQTLLSLTYLPHNVSVILKPEQGLFDLKFIVDNVPFYCEVKVWAILSENQLVRQVDFLKEQDARGVYVLFTKAAAAWSSSDISEQSQGRCRTVGIEELVDALKSISNVSSEVAEVAAAYHRALTSLDSRY